MSASPAASTSEGLLRRCLPLAAVTLAGALLYARTVGFGYTYYDDHALLVGELTYFTRLSNLFLTFGHDAFGLISPETRGHFYRPMLLVSYIVDTVVGGGRPAVYHATNVLLHLAATAVLFALLRTLGARRALASLLSLAFCVHPALVPAVAWIPGRNDSLLALFVIGTVLLLIQLLRTQRTVLVPAVWLGLALVLFTKESGLALVALLPLIVFVERRPEEGMLPRLAPLAGGALVLTIAWMGIRRLALGDFPVGISVAGSNLKMLVVYVGKTVFPIQLSVFPDIRDVSLIPGLAALALLAAAAWWGRARLLGWAGIGLAWYGLFLLPTLFAAPVAGALEHRVYAPIVGLLIFVADVATSRGARVPRVAEVVAALLAAVFAVTSLLRLPDYADDTSFWRSAVLGSPHATRAWHNLAYRSLEANRAEEAERAARVWLELKPGDARAHVVLGASLGRRSRLREAETELRRAIEIDPSVPDAWENLAVLQKIEGRREEARESERRALEVRAGPVER